MLRHLVWIVPLSVCVVHAPPAAAQTKPRTFQAADFHAACLRRGDPPRNCDRTLAAARQRYGGTVTLMQWNSAVGVVRHMNRQGK